MIRHGLRVRSRRRVARGLEALPQHVLVDRIGPDTAESIGRCSSPRTAPSVLPSPDARDCSVRRCPGSAGSPGRCRTSSMISSMPIAAATSRAVDDAPSASARSARRALRIGGRQPFELVAVQHVGRDRRGHEADVRVGHESTTSPPWSGLNIAKNARPNALRRITVTVGHVAAVFTSIRSIALRNMPECSTSTPIWKPGVSTKQTMGNPNRLHSRGHPGGLLARRRATAPRPRGAVATR